MTVAHGPLIPLEQELYLAGCSEVAFVAISHNQASLAGPVPIARVIHHGIRVGDVPVGTGGDAACFVGRMHPSKGMPEAIEAAAIAGIPLRIAAKMQEPAEEEYFEEVVRPALGTNAEYIGELDTDEKYELMGNSCALLNPIQWDEPFGLVMIEAMATGTPVVATRRGSVERDRRGGPHRVHPLDARGPRPCAAPRLDARSRGLPGVRGDALLGLADGRRLHRAVRGPAAAAAAADPGRRAGGGDRRGRRRVRLDGAAARRPRRARAAASAGDAAQSKSSESQLSFFFLR